MMRILSLILMAVTFLRLEARLHHETQHAAQTAFVHGKKVEALKSTASISHKKDDPVKLPEQGYEGPNVAHANFKSITADWGTEYGPTTKKPYFHSFGSRSAGATLLPLVLAFAAALNF